MNRWFGSFVIALALPVIAEESVAQPARAAPHGAIIVGVENLDRLYGKFADWNTTLEMPVGNFEFHQVLLCQYRPRGVSTKAPQSCYPVVWARSLDGKIGYAQADPAYADAETHKPNEWYRVSRKWNAKLEWRLRPSQTSPGAGSGPQSDPNKDYIFPPGNTNNARYAPTNC